MRRLLLGILGIALVGATLAAPARATTPSVSQWVRVFHSQVDLTDGGVTEVLRIGGSSTSRLSLVGVVLSLSTPSSSGDVWLESWPNPAYATDPHPVTKLSGTATSGIWRVRIPLTRYVPAGTYRLAVKWRAGGADVFNGSVRTITIVNPHGDMSPPTLVSLNRPVEGASISQRTTPLISAHVTDTGSGVGLVYFCYLSDSDPSGEQPCEPATLATGTRRDGIWRAPMTLLSMLPTGPASMRVQLVDRVTRDSTWDPADELDAIDGPSTASAIPYGRGDFTIVR
ncbi:hypothetical protein [Nocardioides ultimimeridianus]